MRVFWHIPGFIDIDRPDLVEVASTDAMLNLGRFQEWSRSDGFDHWMQDHYEPHPSQNSPSRWAVMAMMKDGSWWVVAHTDQDPGLPTWKR